MEQTSLFAFKNFVKPNLSERQREVYNAARMMNRSFTDKELAKYLGWEINSITPRRGELKKKGLLQKVGTVLQNGRPATLWEVGIFI